MSLWINRRSTLLSKNFRLMFTYYTWLRVISHFQTWNVLNLILILLYFWWYLLYWSCWSIINKVLYFPSFLRFLTIYWFLYCSFVIINMFRFHNELESTSCEVITEWSRFSLVLIIALKTIFLFFKQSYY